MNKQASAQKQGRIQVKDPEIVHILFGNTSASWIWLLVRLYVGWQWLKAGIAKAGNPAWTGTGDALAGFLRGALAVPEGADKSKITYDWYARFIQGLLDGGHYVWFAKLVVYGEILVGAALILGVFTGIAAFFGTVMNFNFMLAGTVSTNPVLFGLAVFLVLAWKNAGWIGLDRWVLPALGTPWEPGPVVKRQ